MTTRIDYGQTKTIDGVTFKNTHSGQKKAYGDSYYEYDVSSDRPAEDVEKVCATEVYKAMPHKEWQEIYRQPGSSMEHAFKPHYVFRSLGEGRFFYQVCCLYTD